MLFPKNQKWRKIKLERIRIYDIDGGIDGPGVRTLAISGHVTIRRGRDTHVVWQRDAKNPETVTESFTEGANTVECVDLTATGSMERTDDFTTDHAPYIVEAHITARTRYKGTYDIIRKSSREYHPDGTPTSSILASEDSDGEARVAIPVWYGPGLSPAQEKFVSMIPAGGYRHMRPTPY
ncbi:hypothetical protein BGM19_03725 [Streptomyces agglomeratus]|uniref:hypothetical protein n=1 Tax=Streptomyces agglomeratus TaxID=285458 RepID=UPI0008525583|nr:hypothetical protein [Streptomyces agglomeratus]OEJ57223.1 hypothetical protein BGM19_03725 [Streptomyces agglomeratus]